MWWGLLCFLLMVPVDGASKPQCGGTFTAARGILYTPGFPNEFPVPITCEWVIDASEVGSANTSTIVYLTQLYVFEGLTFEEYGTYDKRYRIPGKTIHNVTENNVSKVRWVQTHQNVLVIKFHMENIENTHLRVLDNLLDVYGFNITYEISTVPVRRDPCIMADCGFTGMCYDHYTKFSCDCFSGYTGNTCSSGSSSLCITQGTPVCQNGATCTHVGATAVKCHCPKGFTGEQCHIQETASAYQNCDDCLISCAFDGKPENICQCPKGSNSSSSVDRARFSSTLQLSNVPNLEEEPLRAFLETQISKFLRSNVSRIENFKITNVAQFRTGTEISFYFYGARKDKRRIEGVITKWADRGFVGNLTLIDKDIAFKTDARLHLQKVTINRGGLIREGDEFILSCEAQGSPSMSFRWYKDGLFVNVTPATSFKWTRLIQDPHIKDQYTALLGVGQASILDQGTFTCQIEDYGVQQCKSKHVTIRKPPEVKIEPMSLTVQKGENFTIKCICLSSKNDGSKYTYSWTKNRELLPVKTEMEKYEILYPGGSILQVSRIEKPATYSCLVQDEITSTEVNIQVDVVDRTLVHTCSGEKHLDILWPETAPGTDNVQECPRGFAGIARRSCRLQDAYKPTWQLSDFSSCTANSLIDVDLNFQQLRLGYDRTSGLQTLSSYQYYLNRRSALLPGEGARILTLVRDVISFINSSKDSGLIYNATHIVFDIVDKILTHKNSLMNQSQIIQLQQLVKQQALFSGVFIKSKSVFRQTFTTVDVSMAAVDKLNSSIHIPFSGTSYPPWFSYKLHVTLSIRDYLDSKNESLTLAVVLYRNLSAYLPSRAAIRLKDGAEMEYEIVSNIVSVWLFKDGRDAKPLQKPSFAMEFTHPAKNDSMDQWNINCSVADFATFGYSWEINGCHTKSINLTTTRCTCNRFGTFAILITTKPLTLQMEESHVRQLIVLIGCGVCLVLSFFSLAIIFAYWTLRRSSLVFLKLQCCFGLVGAMIVFLFALSQELTPVSYMYIVSFLEAFILMAMSSHLSKLLVVYTELVHFPRNQNLKKTVVAITTGVPIIAVFGNHLTHQTVGKQQESWWLTAPSLSFNIFITCFVVIFALFLFLYFTVTKKLTIFLVKHENTSKALKKRKELLQRASCVFYSITTMAVTSIVYVNIPNSILCDYLFSASVILMGIVTLVCYVIRSETPMRQHFLRKIKREADEDYFSSESANSPLNYIIRRYPNN